MYGSGTIPLAQGLRQHRQFLVLRMKGLTFTIDPAARWRARESEPPALLNLLPLCWSSRSPIGPQTHRFNAAAPSLTDNHAICPHPLRHMRNLFQARLRCATYAIRRTNHTAYRNHSISTTQNENGTWVAAFGRRNDDLIAAGRIQLAVLETGPEIAEVIAIADAQIEIDDRQTGKGRPQVPNFPIVKT
jgi:hypothetical protein